jgi:6-phosphogluconolactonase (cycloisomerase 2 family)
MKFRKFGKTVLTAALSSAIVFSLSSCVRSFTVGFMYVTGTVTNTPSGNGIVSGFKIDNNTGKLTALNGTPVSSGGANPVRAVLLTGGNFVYVLNAGTNSSGGSTCTASDPCPNANITEFSVGGNGILTYQQTFFTQGFNPFRLLADTSGNYLFALDRDAPGSVDPTAPNSSTNPNQYCATAIAGASTCGDVTVFPVNPTKGRLTLVTNAQLTSSAGTQVTYFPIPANPVDMAFTSSYVMTLSGIAGTPQTIYPYSYNSSNGQLTVSQSTPQFIDGTGPIDAAGDVGNTPVQQATAVVFAGGKVYVLDNEPTTLGGTPGQIIPFTIGTNGALQSLVGGAVADDTTETSPIYLIVESKSKFLYVANQQGSNSTNSAGISIYTIDPSSSQLTEDPGSPVPTTGTGAIPMCLLEDPSNQYIYTANAGDSTVSGHVLDPNSGLLTQMKGTGTGTFSLSGPATWCFATGRTS